MPTVYFCTVNEHNESHYKDVVNPGGYSLGRTWRLRCSPYKKLSYRWETARRVL